MNHKTKSYNQSTLELIKEIDRLKAQLIRKYGECVERWWW